MDELVRVEIDDIIMTNTGFAMVLIDREKERVLPIFIGPFEANGILMKLQGVSFPRPLTYDLIKNIIEMMQGYVEKVVINDLRDGTFYATLYIVTNDQVLEIDSRPSDAVAICVRSGAPIYVTEKVMAMSSIPLEEYSSKKGFKSQEEIEEEASKEKEEPKLYQTKEEKTKQQAKKKEVLIEELKKELEKAVNEERFEDAARIRDEIKKLTEEL
jgi:bifunctional DNase/RNase